MNENKNDYTIRCVNCYQTTSESNLCESRITPTPEPHRLCYNCKIELNELYADTPTQENWCWECRKRANGTYDGTEPEIPTTSEERKKEGE